MQSVASTVTSFGICSSCNAPQQLRRRHSVRRSAPSHTSELVNPEFLSSLVQPSMQRNAHAQPHRSRCTWAAAMVAHAGCGGGKWLEASSLEAKPQCSDGVLNFYTHTLCPYAQRVHLTLLEKVRRWSKAAGCLVSGRGTGATAGGDEPYPAVAL